MTKERKKWKPTSGIKILRWNGILYMDQKVSHEQKMNFEGFTQNGCYGNQSQPLEVSFDSPALLQPLPFYNPCPFTKHDLIFKQAYLVGFCFVLFNKLKF